MERISKPHLVDLLRIFDKRRYLTPRIRYASVRSKPVLIKDLRERFFTYESYGMLHIKKRAGVSHVPDIVYDFEKRLYLFDGVPVNVSAESRKKVVFSIRHEPVTLTWDEFVPTEGQLSKHGESASSPTSPGLGTHNPAARSLRSEPSAGPT